MVLVISAPSADGEEEPRHGPAPVVQRTFLNPWTKAAITPAAAGVGMPTKIFEPPGAILAR